MKNSTFFKRLLGTALSFTVVCSIAAQDYCSFKPYGGSWEDIGPFIGSYRSNPVFFDYNNDGLLDIYYGGQGLPDGGTTQFNLYDQWRPFSNMMKQNADGTFTALLGIHKDAPVAEGVEIPSPVGLPLNSFSAFACFDYNNDGYVDILIQSTKEWGLDYSYCYLFKNLGPDQDYKFEMVPEAVFRQGANEGKSYQSVVTGDFDKDGFIDVLMIGIDDISRYVELYKNNGDGTFTSVKDVTLKNPVFIGGEHIDDYEGFRPMSKGCVVFADLDNDGWLDIISNGWTDGSPEGFEPEVSGGPKVAIYKNMQDGTFQEVTPDDFTANSYDSEIKVGDFDRDGFLDIFITGDSKKNYLLLNNQDGTYTTLEHTSLGIRGVDNANVVVGDINNDGLLDIITSGWPEDPDGDKVTCVYYGKSDGTFFFDDAYPLLNANEGGLTLGDIDGDNTLDVFVDGYKRNNDGRDVWGSTPAILHYNEVEGNISANTPPTAPGNVSANYNSGKLTITWTEASDDHSEKETLIYNIFVKDNTTGEIFSLIPADIESGKLRALGAIFTGVRALEYSMTTTMDLENKTYTIGVQAIDQSYAGGLFASTQIGNGLGITDSEVTSKVKITLNEEGILVNTEDNAAVVITDLSGRTVAQGYANTVIPVSAKGLYLVSVKGNTYKVIK